MAQIDILMRFIQPPDVRTTLTLDDDAAARLQAESRRRGLPFKTLLNEHLRVPLAQRHARRTAPALVVAPVDLGGPVAGRSYDDIAALLDDAEGADRR